MTHEEYQTLFTLVRKYQINKTVVDSNLYRACEMLLDELWPHYFAKTTPQDNDTPD
jgi:hypothetical protein